MKIDVPRIGQKLDTRRTRPEGDRKRVGEIGLVDGWIRSIGIDQGKKFARNRHTPVGISAECGSVDRRDKCLCITEAGR